MALHIGLAFITATLFLGELAFALPPTKVHVCAAAFRQIALTQPEIFAAKNAYTINSFGSFRDRVLKMNDVAPDIPEGFASSLKSGWGLNQKTATARINGIEHFARTSEAADPSKRNFTQGISIVGKENIETFVSELRENIRILEDAFTKHSHHPMVLRNALGTLVPSFMVHLNPDVDLSNMVVISALLLQHGWDYFLRRPLHWDTRILGQLETGLKAANSGEWALISRNFTIHPDSVENLRGLKDEKLFIENGISQSRIDAAPLYDKFMPEPIGGLKREDLDTSWVGLDMLFERNAAGEPELHVVIRGSEDRPIFPKTRKKKEKETSVRPSPQLLPGLAPVPIRN